jgi:hypothetical protein
MKKLLLVAGLLIAASVPAHAKDPTIKCAGLLVDVDLKPKALWPLAVIYDEEQHLVCTIDRANSGHDPLKRYPCVKDDTGPGSEAEDTSTFTFMESNGAN